MTSAAAARILADYPRIFFACHSRHVRDPDTGGEVSQHQASILQHLDEKDPTTVSELAEHMGVTLSTMSLSVKRLVREGYVSKSGHPSDGRVVQLRLTPGGVRVTEADQVLDPGRVEALLTELSHAEKDVALHGLSLLARAADQMFRRWTESGAGGWRESSA